MTADKNPSPQPNVTPEYERQEAICTDAAMSQWERSLKRPDMQEKDRVCGAVEAYKRQALAFRMLPPAPEKHVAGKEPTLDWGNFQGPKRNVDWNPDDQDLIYTALNYRDDEYGDADEDVGQQIAERLLSAWNRAAVSEQITFEIAARLLKERDAADSARVDEWRLRRDVEGSRDAARAAAETLRMERDEARKALKLAIEHIEHMAAFIGSLKAGYSFESLGEDMPGIKAALATTEGKDNG